MKKSKLLALLMVLAFGSALLAAAAVQEKPEDMVKDPVCGMSIKKAEAKASFEYKGTTYYFCHPGCKDKFAQDPEKYLQKQAEKAESAAKCPMAGKAAYACPMHKDVTSDKPGKCPKCGMDMAKPEMAKGQGCPMMKGEMAMMHGQAGEAKGMACPMAGMMHNKDVEFKVENTKDGVQVSISSKDAEMVKKLQDMAAKMKAGCNPETCAKEKTEK